MASPTSSGTGSSNPFVGNPQPAPAGIKDILTPTPMPQRPRNDIALDTASMPSGGRVLKADPPGGSVRVQTGMTGPGSGGMRMPFTIRGG